MDSLKGLLIILVIFGHLIGSFKYDFTIINIVYTFIYLFHIPIFVFISGYLSNQKNILKNFLIYVLFQILYYFFVSLFTHTLDFKLILLVPFHHLWYLFAIIVWNLIFKYIKKFKMDNSFNIKVLFILSIIGSILIGFKMELGLAFSLQRIFVFFPFFILGIIFRKDKYSLNINHQKRFFVVFFILACALIFSIKYCPFDNFEWIYGKLSYETGNYSYIFRIIQLIFGFLGIFICLCLFNNSKENFLSKIGKKSFYYYVYHDFFIILFSCLLKDKFLSLFAFKGFLYEFLMLFLLLIILILIIIIIKMIIFLVNYIFNKKKR